MLLARDLSRDGLRIESTERLAIGDALKLAVFGVLDAAPLLAAAAIERCDDFDGWFLRFGALGDETTVQLDTLLESLAPLDLDLPLE